MAAEGMDAEEAAVVLLGESAAVVEDEGMGEALRRSAGESAKVIPLKRKARQARRKK